MIFGELNYVFQVHKNQKFKNMEGSRKLNFAQTFMLKLDKRNMILYHVSKLLPSKLFIRLMVHHYTGKKVNFKSPRTFTDFIARNRLENNDFYTLLSDKIRAKEIVNDLKIDIYCSRILWIGYDLTKINYNDLPKKFVIKSNHFSGDAIVVHDKNQFNILKSNRYFSKILNLNYYYFAREIYYKNIKPKLFIEEFLGENIVDYKFFCFKGAFKFCHIVEDRGFDLKDYMIDKDYNNLNFNLDNRSFVENKVPKKPNNYGQMIHLAELLSKGIDFVRIDLYEVNNIIYFGEFTFFPWGGNYKILPRHRDQEIEDLLGSYFNS